MADNTKGIPFNTENEGINFPFMAKEIAYLHGALPLGVEKDEPTFSLDDVYVVWFTYTLGYWKALCSTSLPDGRYYEVTYNAEKKVAYVDTYKKTHNIEVNILPPE
jgi:hypothetical protein